MESGWIRLYRKLEESTAWRTSNAIRKVVLVTILLSCSYKKNTWVWMGEEFAVEPGQFVTSLEKLANKAGPGVSVQNVRSALKHFEKVGFLTDKSTKSGRLITVANWDTYQGSETQPNKDSNNRPTKTQQLSIKKEGKNTSIDVEFSAFWESYPRKVSQKTAMKAWKKLNPDVYLIEAIMAALDIHKATAQWQRDNGRYIPHPSTWLNERRWEDQVTPSKSSVPDFMTGG